MLAQQDIRKKFFITTLYNLLIMKKKNGVATKIRTRDPLITNQTTSEQMRQETLI